MALTAGVEIVTTGALRSTTKGPKSPDEAQLPARSHTVRPSAVAASDSWSAPTAVARVNDASASFARPPAWVARQWISTSVEKTGPPVGASHQMAGAVTSGPGSGSAVA